MEIHFLLPLAAVLLFFSPLGWAIGCSDGAKKLPQNWWARMEVEQ